MKRFALFLALLLIAAPAVAQWQLPIGIPATPMDLFRVRPANTALVSTVPSTIAAGQVVTLSGQVPGRTVTCAGTVTNPAWILGTPGSRLIGPLSITGTGCLIDGVTGYVISLSGDGHLLRHSEFSGVPTDRQMTGISVNGTNIVVFRNKVHDFGNLNATDDQDAHGMGCSRGCRNVWFVENDSARNSGDGVNVNPYPYDAAGLTAISHIFIGRNTLHDNKQTGQWAKQSTDIIVSENEIYGHHASNSSYGQGAGYQYSTNRIWFLKNNLHDNDVGIGVSGGFEGAPVSGAVLLANTITRAKGTSCGDGPVWSCAGIRLTGDAYTYLLNNTLTDVIDGVHAVNGRGLYVAGTVGNTHVATENTPSIPGVDLAARYKEAYGLDISSLTGTAPVIPPPPQPPPVITPIPPVPPVTPPAPPNLPPCPRTLLGRLAYIFGRCVW
ncbi:MAG: right-handed parallel beta-helix repeat-containing protein [Vicinamibacterales bacterium]